MAIEPLGYTTSIVSWSLLWSAMRRLPHEANDVRGLDLNLETPSLIILSATAIEAFVNEVSSLTHAFQVDQRADIGARFVANPTEVTAEDVSAELLDGIGALRERSKGSFLERYQRLLRGLQIEEPDFSQELSWLRGLRNALVHFRACDIPIVEDAGGVILYEQEPPAVLSCLSERYLGRYPIVADGDDEWPLRISTNAMSVWVLNLTLDALLFVLDNLPEGRYGRFVWHRYRAAGESHGSLFEKAKADIQSAWLSYTGALEQGRGQA